MGQSIREPWVHVSFGDEASPSLDWCQDVGRINWWDAAGDTDAGAAAQPVKTIYDPSPAGFRVPTDEVLNADAEVLKALPLCGYRNSHTGLLSKVGQSGFYWSSTAADENSARVYMNDSENTGGLGRRCRGLSLRPAADK